MTPLDTLSSHPRRMGERDRGRRRRFSSFFPSRPFLKRTNLFSIVERPLKLSSLFRFNFLARSPLGGLHRLPGKFVTTLKMAARILPRRRDLLTRKFDGDMIFASCNE